MSLMCFLIFIILVGWIGNILFNVFYVSKGKWEMNVKKVWNKCKKSVRWMWGKCEVYV